MYSKFLTNNSMRLFEYAMDGAVLRQEAIANNIANISTPGYKATEVSFADELRNATKNVGAALELRTTNSRHIKISDSTRPDSFQPRVFTETSTTLRNDGNNVDIDREIAKLTSNEIYFDAVTRNLNDEFNLLKLVIRQGG